MRISVGSSDVCSSDLVQGDPRVAGARPGQARARRFRDRNRPSEKRDASPDSRHHLLFPCPIGSRLPYRMREIIFDTETTGLDPRAGHRLVEIGSIVLIERRETGRTFQAYFHPEPDIPAAPEEVDGLCDQFLSSNK